MDSWNPAYIITDKIFEMYVMSMKEKIKRCLARVTCDKYEMNRIILKYKKCFDEACAALNGKK